VRARCRRGRLDGFVERRALNPIVKGWIFGREVKARRIRFGLLRGQTFVIDPRDKSQRLLGLEEKEIAAHVRAAAARSRTAIDVGAHDGWYATFFASRPNLSRVIACDPNQGVVDRLVANINLNGLASKVDVHRVSVGPSKAGFRSLDELLRHETPPFVIKIDVDGGELDVLRSGLAVLRDADCSLIVETHSLDLEEGCLSYLRQLGYQTTVVPNGWYRFFIPELRNVAHNRWFVASRAAP
jgi:methyltransferase FkbM-like protein